MTEATRRGHPWAVGPRSAVAGSQDDALDLSTLYRDHAGFVWRVVRRFGVPDAQLEDVVHEVFLVAWRKLAEYEGRGAPTSWLYGIARGVSANHRRGCARAERRLHAVPPAPPRANPEDALAQRDAIAQVAAFVASLPDEQRAVFELCDVEGLAGPEVAKMLRIKLNLVYSRLRLARRRFEQFIAGGGRHAG